MGRGENLTEKKKEDILCLSAKGYHGTKIAQELQISAGTVYAFLRRCGEDTVRVCAVCNKTIRDGEAVFCPYCGKKILTEKDRALERLSEVGKLVGEMPGAYRDRLIAIVGDVRKYIREH